MRVVEHTVPEHLHFVQTRVVDHQVDDLHALLIEIRGGVEVELPLVGGVELGDDTQVVRVVGICAPSGVERYLGRAVRGIPHDHVARTQIDAQIEYDKVVAGVQVRVDTQARVSREPSVAQQIGSQR